MEKLRFNKLFHGLCITFSKEAGDELRDIYYEALKEYPDKDVISAINSCIKLQKFFPAISEIIQSLPKLSVGEAWQRVLKVAENGGRGWEILSDIEIRTISDMGGLRKIQDGNIDYLNLLEKEFSEIYLKIIPIRINPECRFRILAVSPESISHKIEKQTEQILISENAPKEIKEALANFRLKVV